MTTDPIQQAAGPAESRCMMRKITTIELPTHELTVETLLQAAKSVPEDTRVTVRTVPGDRNESPTTFIVLTHAENV